MIEAPSTVWISIDQGLIRDGLAHARIASHVSVAMGSSTALTWLSTLTVLSLSIDLTAKLLVCLHEFAIVQHLSLKLHHHGYSLLVDVL